MNTIYLASFVLSLGYFIFSWFFGHLDQGDVGDHDSHEFGDHDEIHTGHGEVSHDASKVSPISLRTIFAFLLAFGGSGLLTNSLWGWTLLISFPLSVASGFLTAFGMWKLTVFLVKQSYTDVIRAYDFLGLEGQVISAIPEHGYGTITLIVRGQRENIPARTEGGEPLSYGAAVEVVGKEESYVVVRPLDALPKPI